MIVANVTNLVIVRVHHCHLLNRARLDPILTALLGINILGDNAKDGVVLVHVLETDLLLLQSPYGRLPLLLLHGGTVNNRQ